MPRWLRITCLQRHDAQCRHPAESLYRCVVCYLTYVATCKRRIPRLRRTYPGVSNPASTATEGWSDDVLNFVMQPLVSMKKQPDRPRTIVCGLSTCWFMKGKKSKKDRQSNTNRDF